jgi:mannose-6-phosphate isomerase-like protein (cupin superfamily)
MANSKQKVCITRGANATFQGDGLRQQIVYRDLGIRDATAGRFNAHIMRTGSGERKVPRHVHTVDLQLLYILDGWIKMWLEGDGEVTLKPGDSCLIPGGVQHEVLDWSDDFELLEVTSPAEYETLDAPAG